MKGIMRTARRSLSESAEDVGGVGGISAGSVMQVRGEVNSGIQANREYFRIMAKNYESDVTQFIKQFKQTHPDAEHRQRDGSVLYSGILLRRGDDPVAGRHGKWQCC